MNSALVDALRQNYIAYFRLFHGQHGIHVHVDDSVAWIIANGPPGNHILRTDFAAVCVDEQLDAFLRMMATRTGGLRWLLFPSDRPQDLGLRLLGRGLQKDKGDLWMFRSLHDLVAPASLAACRIGPVTDMPGLRAWWTASAQGFGMTQRTAQIWYDAYRRHGFGPHAYAIHYIGSVDRGTRDVVSSATLVLAGGIAGIYDVSTLPKFRRMGYASALLGSMLAAARRHGYTYAGLQTADAVPFYERLGFTVGFQENEYFWTAKHQ